MVANVVGRRSKIFFFEEDWIFYAAGTLLEYNFFYSNNFFVWWCGDVVYAETMRKLTQEKKIKAVVVSFLEEEKKCVIYFC